MGSNVEQDGKPIAAESSLHVSECKEVFTAFPDSNRRERPAAQRWHKIVWAPGVWSSLWSHAVMGYLVAILGQVIAVSFIALFVHSYPLFHFSSALVLFIIVLVSLGWGAVQGLVATLTGALLLLLPLSLIPPVLLADDMFGMALYMLVGVAMSLLIGRIQRERQAAQALSQRLETIIETFPDPLTLYDAAGQVLQHNRSAREAQCIEQESASSVYALNMRKSSNQRTVFEDLPLVRALRGEQVNGVELCYVPLGSQNERIVAISAAPLRTGAQGTIVGAVTITRDLTTLRQAEREASQRASELEAIIEALPEALYVYDAAGRVVRMNPAGQALLKRAAYPGLAKSVEELWQEAGNALPGHALEAGQIPTARLLSGEVLTAGNAAEVMLPAREGDDIRLSVTGAPLYDHLGEINGAVAICHDITDYRRVEEALRASEERYRTIVETANEGIWLLDREARTLYVNDRMAELLGVSAAEMLGRAVGEYVFPEDEAESRRRMEHSLRGVVEQFECRFRCRDGRLLETMASTSPIRDAQGAIVGSLGLFTDLTARKQIEEAFEHRDTLLRLALRNSPIAVFQQDLDLRYTWMENPPSSTPEAIVGKTDADFVSPEQAADLYALKQRVLTAGESIHEEFETRTRGSRWEILTLEPLRDRQGKIVGLSGTAINITERKKLEQEREQFAQQAYLRANELEAIFETITDAIEVLDSEGNVVRMNQSARQLCARYQESVASRQPKPTCLHMLPQRDWQGQILSEERRPIRRLLQGETLSGAQNQDLAVTTREGEELLLNVAGAPLSDVEGKVIGAVAVTRDLTEQRRLEQRIQLALQALLEMAETMVQGRETGQGLFSDVERSDLRHMAQQFATLIRQILGCERLCLYQMEASSEQMLPLAVVGLSAEQANHWWAEHSHVRTNFVDSPDPALIERLRQHEIVIVDMTQPPWNRQPNPYGIRSMLVAPLSLKSRLIGLLKLDYSGREHIYTAEELTLTRAVCRLIALLIEREDLLALNERLSELIERAHDAVIVRDADNRVLLWNKGAECLYALSKQDAIGKITHALLNTRFPVSQQEVERQLTQVGEWEGILTHQQRGGSEVIVESRQVLLHDVAGKPAFMLEINRDITEREQARASALAARETTRQMDAFMGIASHELKTPLTSIKGNLQLSKRRLAIALQQIKAKDEIAQRTLEELHILLERAERQVNVQARLVSDLVDMSRIQTEKLELRLTEIDLGRLVRVVVEDQRFAAGSHPLRIEIPEESILVLADAVRIEQVLGNYLSNALKYSPPDRPVQVRLSVQDEQVRVEVTDQGPGLSQEQQANIWERFYRVPGIVVQSGSSVGLGLGLYINRTLIEQHQGQVGIESTPGFGATFWFSLPLASALIV